jgi:hypothetical protein
VRLESLADLSSTSLSSLKPRRDFSLEHLAANLRFEDHALAHSPEDEWQRALPCPESSTDVQPR